MNYVIAVLIGLLVGTATGYAAQRLPAPPAVQSIGAAIVSMVLASIGTAVVWLLRPPRGVGIVAVSFGVSEGILTCVVALVLAAGIHVALGRLGVAVHPGLVSHRCLIMGILGGLTGALASVSGTGGVHPPG